MYHMCYDFQLYTTICSSWRTNMKPELLSNFFIALRLHQFSVMLVLLSCPFTRGKSHCCYTGHKTLSQKCVNSTE